MLLGHQRVTIHITQLERKRNGICLETQTRVLDGTENEIKMDVKICIKKSVDHDIVCKR